MNTFDKEVQVFYERFDKALKTNDIKELAFFNQFTAEKDIRKWSGHIRRQICENARNFQYALACGITKVVLRDYGWLDFHIPGFEQQEFHPLGCIINRNCCNTKEDKALGIMQLPNGNWIAEIGSDYTSIGHSYLYLDIFAEQFPTKSEAWNAAIKRFVDRWHDHNKDVKKEDEAVIKAKSMIIVDAVTPPPAIKGTPIQLSLF